MTRQNRVTPYGEVIRTSARGAFTGNRGCLHDDQGNIRRFYRGTRWIICVLVFKGRRRKLMQPGQYTELFFLDEATALAAGHRPCAECQRERFERFRTAWAAGNPARASGGRPSAVSLDDALQQDRIAADGRKMTYPAQLRDLPDGTFAALEPDGEPYLVLGANLWHWTPAGYARPLPRPQDATVHVLTPRSVVAALAAGYPVQIDPSATAL
jgi:hypothetical protein